MGVKDKQMEDGREMHLFAEALTILILNKEVKLIRFISSGCL